jgi:hypothetical protein
LLLAGIGFNSILADKPGIDSSLEGGQGIPALKTGRDSVMLQTIKPTTMKTILRSAFWLLPTLAFAQGNLTPPGPPAPAMKTLQQIEPRIDVQTLPGDPNDLYIITNSGSYYLTTNIVGVSGKYGILIDAANVSLDLNGFTLIGVPSSFVGISGTANVRSLTIRNGTIRNWGSVGLQAPGGLEVSHVYVSGNSGFGISAGGNSLIRDCASISNSSTGILAGSGSRIIDCTVTDNGNLGINAGGDWSRLADAPSRGMAWREFIAVQTRLSATARR